jgi:hypothetical protein
MADYPEFDALLSRFLDGAASAEEMATLEMQLHRDERFAEHFARWCLAHRQITELLTEGELHKLMDQFVTSAPAFPKQSFRRPAGLQDQPAETHSVSTRHDDTYPRRVSQVRWARRLSAIAVAAVVIVGSAWLFSSLPLREQSQPLAVNTAPSEEDAPALKSQQPAATLTQVVDGTWADDAPRLHHGQPLPEGSRIALASGMAKVTFDCGAEVALQGPCDFVVQNRMVGVLRSGRITANVPRRAFSFAILSPQVDFIDLGTSFGIAVGNNGKTQLHVFEGEVLCSPSQPQDGERNKVIHVTANKAMEFALPSQSPNDIQVNEQDFSNLIALRRAAHVEPGHVTERNLALWLAADVAVTTDPTGRVIAWQDILYGDNQSAEDAVQADENARPLLVSSCLNGRPAIRFDGSSDFLLTTPLETTDDQTVLFVCQFSPSAFDKSRRWGGQIINYDGPPSRYLSDTLEPGVLQIGEPLLEKEFKPSLLTGQVFAGFIGSAVVESGRVDTRQIGINTPVVVAFVYDYEYGKSYLTINGRSFGEARAFAPQGITSRKIIGRHAWMQNYFHGDLAELLIFNQALSPKELDQTTEYLAKKYGIALDR